jgi:ribosomal protein S18 acetylase RimI-like enzyme
MGQTLEVNIRSITEEDIEGVLAVDRKITGRDRAVTYSTVPNSYVGGEMDVSVVAEAGGEIVGFLLGRISDSPCGLADAASLQLFGVDPACRRQGIATRLVEAFTDRCRERGVRSIHVLVSWHDWWLLSFLGSMGFARGEMAEFIRPLED